jgi:nitrate/nitrite transport system ATP-binding protein
MALEIAKPTRRMLNLSNLRLRSRPADQAIAMPHAPDICVSIRNVSKVFETRKGPMVALKDINLDIRSGEFISLIGHSGCGKSTLLNIIAGMLAPSSGTAVIDGQPISGPGPDRGVVFQNYSLLPWLTVRSNIYEAVDAVHKTKTRPEKHALVDGILDTVGLTPHHEKRPAQISGGMKQRVAIARAFATHPKVLLLDEPFGALDALTKGALHDELLEILSGDVQTDTAVMVTHDIDEAIYLSDRIVVMTNGPAATIGEIVEVPLPRPRDKRALLHTEAWTKVKERLLYLLTEAYGHVA